MNKKTREQIAEACNIMIVCCKQLADGADPNGGHAKAVYDLAAALVRDGHGELAVRAIQYEIDCRTAARAMIQATMEVGLPA